MARRLSEVGAMIENAKKPSGDWFYPSANFGALPPELSSREKSRIVVLPVPYEATTTYGAGCRHGPSAIIEASTNMELYDEELRWEPSEIGIYTFPPLEIMNDAEGMIERIDTVVTANVGEGKFVTVLGGEHTVTVGAVRALQRIHPDLSVLSLDAHADFRDSYHGSKYNHACVSRRISEFCHLVQAGIRSLSREESYAMDSGRVVTFWAAEFRNLRNAEGRPDLVNRIVDRLGENVYISIDADVFDPSIMPAVGTPEPGGLLWEDVLTLVRRVAELKTIVGLDFVELAPVAGLSHPQFTAARLLYKIWGYNFRDGVAK